MAPRPPTDLRPMKAVSAEVPPTGEAWVHEVKWDGMRVLARCAEGTTTLTTSNGLDATGRFPELLGVGEAAGCAVILDGEVVAVDDAGRPDFGRLQQRMHLTSAAEVRHRAADVPVALAVFDLLWLDGHDLCPLPWRDRRDVLERLLEPAPAWRLSPVHDDGVGLLAIADERGLEGIVSKRADSTYQPGKRSPAWRKVKVRRHQEFVVGGWWPGERSRAGRLGSLIIGVHDPSAPGNPLRFAGKVGTGFTEPVLASYEALFAGLATDECPFEPPPPRAISRLARWVRPEVVVEVAFGEWTTEGVLRHPSHLGRRLDKDPAEVVRE
jgi:bifunctional non-homologous end joining protein LigD